MIGGEKVAQGFIMHTCYPKLWTWSFLIFRGKGEEEVQSWYKQRSGKFVRNCFRNFVICESNFILRGGKQIEERKMRKKEEEEEKERANFSVFCRSNHYLLILNIKIELSEKSLALDLLILEIRIDGNSWRKKLKGGFRNWNFSFSRVSQREN